MDNRQIMKRVAALRRWMAEEGYDVFIIPSSDPHGSEYPPEHWECRQWISGFTGSAGTAVVTTGREAALWTDSRYFIQAEEQLRETPFTLMRDGEPDTPDISAWIREKVGEGACVAYYAGTMNVGDATAFAGALEPDYEVKAAAGDPFRAIWTDRPEVPAAPLREMPESVAGTSAAEKLAFIFHTAFADHETEGAVMLNDLGDIAWALNLRGNDVAYNPVFVAYLLVGQRITTLFTNEERLSPALREKLSEARVHVKRYKGWRNALRDLPSGFKVALPPTANVEQYVCCTENDIRVVPCRYEDIALKRAVKTPEEQAGFREAMERDGVAMVRFLRRLDEAMAGGETVTEVGVNRMLTAFRAQEKGFIDLSFATIAGYGPHGAIVHYEADAESDATLAPQGLLLLDSGAHYDCGTTDITRTIALGPVSDEERRVYTAVLKAHIGLSRCVYPEGTTGLQLDTAARYPLWRMGYDFGHGTGHGVGSQLCVHEGPHQIRKNTRACTLVPFRPGMTVTDEPGVYVAGHFGVRIENTLLVVPHGDTAFGRFLAFEPLTLCPIDLRPVDTALLDSEERQWLNAYHAEVRERLSPRLADPADRAWLDRATQAI